MTELVTELIIFNGFSSFTAKINEGTYDDEIDENITFDGFDDDEDEDDIDEVSARYFGQKVFLPLLNA